MRSGRTTLQIGTLFHLSDAMKTPNYFVISILFFLAAFSMSGVLLAIQGIFQVPPASQLPMYGPTFAALLFLWKEKQSIVSFFKRCMTFTITGSVLLILVIPIVLTGCISYWTQTQWGLVNVRDMSPTISLILAIAALFFGGIGEEIGWRGYLLPKLQERFTPFISSLILGIIWGCWHTPIMLPNGIVFFIIWFVELMGGNLLFTYAYNEAKPSIWSAILLHNTLNLMGFCFLQHAFDISVLIMCSTGYFISGLLVVLSNWKAFSTKTINSN